MIQTVNMAQELFAKAALVDCDSLRAAQRTASLVRAESCLQDAFSTDVRPVIAEWRVSQGLPPDPMDAFCQSGYLERITLERAARNQAGSSTYA
jgi:L-rhamnose isomerase/sugar isomerase